MNTKTLRYALVASAAIVAAGLYAEGFTAFILQVTGGFLLLVSGAVLLTIKQASHA